MPYSCLQGLLLREFRDVAVLFISGRFLREFGSDSNPFLKWSVKMPHTRHVNQLVWDVFYGWERAPRTVRSTLDGHLGFPVTETFHVHEKQVVSDFIQEGLGFLDLLGQLINSRDDLGSVLVGNFLS